VARELLFQPRIGARPGDQTAEPANLGAQHTPSAIGEAVVAALRLLAVQRIRSGRLLDRPFVLQALNRLVQGAGTDADRALGAAFDLLLDGIAVLGAVGEDQQDVENGRG
jgi:hypothetical protein